MSDGPSLPPELKERVVSAVSGEPSPTRRAVLLRAGILLATASVVSILVFLWWGGLRAAPRPPLLILGATGGAALLAGGAAWLVLDRVPSMLGRARVVLIAVVVGAPLALLAWKLAVSSLFEGMTTWWPERPGFRCLRLSLLVSLAPLLALLFLRRRSDPVHPVAAGAALGTVVGSFAWVLVDLWCPVAHPRHLLLGHVLPLVLVALAGALVGGLVLRLRSR
jgi:hypothetical protein